MIKHYTLTMIDKLGKIGRATFYSDDDGSHTNGLAISNAIIAKSNAGVVSLSCTENVAIATTVPDVTSDSVNKRCKINYRVQVGNQRSGLLTSVPDCDDTIVKADNPIVKAINDPLGIYTIICTEEGHNPEEVIQWAKFSYKALKL